MKYIIKGYTISTKVVIMFLEAIFAVEVDESNSIVPTDSFDARGVIRIPIVFFDGMDSPVSGDTSHEARHLVTPLDPWVSKCLRILHSFVSLALVLGFPILNAALNAVFPTFALYTFPVPPSPIKFTLVTSYLSHVKAVALEKKQRRGDVKTRQDADAVNNRCLVRTQRAHTCLERKHKLNQRILRSIFITLSPSPREINMPF